MAFTQISTKGIKDGTITGADLATNVDLVDNKKIRFGTGNDLQIYHDGSNSYIQNSTGLLYVRGGGDWLALQAEDGENSIICKPNGTVELYHDNSKKLETTSGGVTVTGKIFADSLDMGDNERVLLGASDDLQIFHNGSHSKISDTGTGSLILSGSTVEINNAADSENMIKAVENGAVELYYDNSKKFETNNTGAFCTGELGCDTLYMSDNDKAKFGSNDDLQIYHDGSHSVIENSTGNLHIKDDIIKLQSASGEQMIQLFGNGAVELFYDNGRKLATTTNGVKITDNFLGINLDSPSGTPGGRNAFLALGDSDTGVAQNGDGQLELWANNQEIMNIDTGEITAYKPLRPNSNNAHELGGSGHRWSTIFSQNALNTSDKNLKNTITDSDLGLSFINKLRPVSYKWNQKKEEISDTKTHYGLIAQEIETALASEGKTLDNFAGVYKPNDYKEDGTGGAMAIAVSELISPLIKAVQELSAEVAALKAS